MKLILFIFLLLPLFSISQIKYISDNIIGSLKGEIISEKQKNDTLIIQVKIPYNDINIVASQVSYITKRHNSKLKSNWIYSNDEYYCEYEQNKKIINIKFIPDKQLLVLKL